MASVKKLQTQEETPGALVRKGLGSVQYLALLSGLVTLGVEMTLGRLISPFLGSTVFTWGAIISSIILCLAMGSFLGGELSTKSRDPKQTLTFLLIGSAAYQLLVPLIGPPFLNALAGKVHVYGSDFMINATILFGVSLVLAAPSLVPLAMTTPLLMAFLGPNDPHPARLAGRLMGLGTLGSCLGVVVALFIGVPELGTRLTLWLFALITALGILLLKNPGPAVAALLVIGLSRFAIQGPLREYSPHNKGAHIETAQETPYTFAEVFEANGFKYLGIEDSFITYSKVHLDSGYSMSYWDIALMAPFARKNPQPKRVLILGYGAGVSYKQFVTHYPTARVEAVEIDPTFIPLSKEYFRVDPDEKNIHLGDARPWLKALKGPYDVVMLDVYHSSNIPFYMLTEECFKAIRQISSKDAVLAFNFAFPGEKQKFLNQVLAGAKPYFPNIQLVQVTGHSNLIVMASPSPLSVKEAEARVKAYFSQETEPVQKYLASLGKQVAASKSAKTKGAAPFTDDFAPTEILGAKSLAWHIEEQEKVRNQPRAKAQ